MRLLLDENLSPRLVGLLADLYPGMEHVQRLGLGSADDAQVWQYAKLHGLAIVSKENAPPKVVWLRLGNCSTTDVEKVLRSTQVAVHRFLEEDEETCLMCKRHLSTVSTAVCR